MLYPAMLYPAPQLYYPATLTPGAAVVYVLAQAGTLALPASQLLVAEEDRTRVWHDLKVRAGRGGASGGGARVAR